MGTEGKIRAPSELRGCSQWSQGLLALLYQDLIRTSIHDEYDLMLCWHFFLSILRV